jgi:diaminopropionate ammonia-lyase
MQPMRAVINPYREAGTFPRPSVEAVRAFHRTLPGYAPTPLVSRPDLARVLGLGELLVKFEGPRFGLMAFKSLGAAWALQQLVERNGIKPSAVATATDGNHGRGVAWAARLLGIPAMIYLPAHVAAERIDRIVGEKARVVLVHGNYDDAVRLCAEQAAAEGWQVVADIGYDGYLEVPRTIVEGYSTLFAEIDEALAARRAAQPDLVLVPGGVGGLLHAAIDHYRQRESPPRIVVAEPSEADCLTESISAPEGRPTSSRGTIHSVMACLNAGTVSLTSWPTVRRGTDVFLAIEDRFAEEALRLLHRPTDGAEAIPAGESGAASLAGLLALVEDDRFAEARRFLELGPSTRALVVCTEGMIDPDAVRRILDGGTDGASP